jgi:hypothetical protein
MDEAAKAEFEEQLKGYRKLEKIKGSDEFQDFFDYQVKFAVDRMLYCFIGDNIKTYDDFCRERGKVIATLVPIQEIYDASAAKKRLREQIDDYYRKDVDI